MRPVQLLLAAVAAAAMIEVVAGGQGYLFPQSACRVRCENGGACAYDTEDPSIHSCICLVGVYEGERCEILVPGAVDPSLTTTTTTTTAAAPTTESAYEVERRRHEEHRMRIMEERRKHEEERKRLEEERRRVMEERARADEARRAEMENRGREEEARRRQAEEEHKRRVEEERRQTEERRVHEERRRQEEEEKRRTQEEAQRMDNHQKVETGDRHEPTHKLDYDDYEDSLDGERMEEVPEEKNTVDEDEDIDRVESAEMEKPEDLDEDEDEDDDDEATPAATTPEPTSAVTYEVEDDYVTSTTPTVEQTPSKKKDTEDSRMSGEDDDYWDHTPCNPDVEDCVKPLPPLPGDGTAAADDKEDLVRGTEIDQSGRAIGDKRFVTLDEAEQQAEEELEQDGEDGWMMVKRKQTASSSSYTIFTVAIAAVVARWAL